VPVQPHLHRPRAVRADLDERRAEVGVPEVEVVHGDAAVGLVEGELRSLGRVGITLAGDEHPLDLLSHPDRSDLRPAGRRGRIQVRAHHVDVAVSGGQLDHRHVVGQREGLHRPAEPVPDLLQTRRRRDRVPAMGQELDHLPADLQLTEVTVQVDPVQAVHVQLHVPVQNLVDGHRVRPCQP